jgi:hypothetical protein
MPETKDLGSRVVILGGKIYGPGEVVFADEAPAAIANISVDDAFGSQDFYDNLPKGDTEDLGSPLSTPPPSP